MPPDSTEHAISYVNALRGCILLLSQFTRSRPAAELALRHLLCFGHYAATGDRPHDPKLSWHVSLALTAVVRKHNELGRQSRGDIAPLLARIHQGYRTHPDVQAWAAAQSLEEALRLAVCLGTVD